MVLRNLLIVLVMLSGQFAFSSDRMGQARLFFGSTTASPSELNTELTAQGLKNVDLNNQAGLEITFPVMTYLNFGMRYTKRLISQDEVANAASTDYKVEMNQDVADLVARIPFYKSDFVRLDGVIGAGGSNSKYEIKTATQDGELEKKGTPFATPHALAGLSLGLGKDKYYFVIEAGYDMNKVDGFTRSGTINNNVNTVDLSGGYLTLGLMFDGIPIFTK
ncbi:hypothetical protein CIK05_04500 [Bdellovibrio sp. qaytius]|nr:hypothetical protein CIK05_04500 [Bdellovibrio sp. qaytius]